MKARCKKRLLSILSLSVVFGLCESSFFLLREFNESSARRAINYMVYDFVAILPLVLLLFLIWFACSRLIRGLTGELLIRRETEESFIRFEVVLSLILLSAMFLLLPNRPGSFIPSRTIPFLALWAILSLGFVIVTRWYSPDRLFGRVRSVALGAILVSSIGIAMWGYYRNRLELPAGGAEGNPNIILISIDTLRADALSCYGQQVDSSPNIDRLAASGVVFKKAFAPSS
jgi:glucan phosphoethanolaminetransferase (alkaline phosphatase superfamily)